MPGLNAKLRSLDHEIAQLNIASRDLKSLIYSLETRVNYLEGGKPTSPSLECEKTNKPSSECIKASLPSSEGEESSLPSSEGEESSPSSSEGEESSPLSMEGGMAAPPVEKIEVKDTDVHLPGSSDEEKDEVQDPETEKRRAENLKQYEERMAKRHIVSKTSVLFDVMPRDNETDLEKMLLAVRSINMDGLHWGEGQRESVAFGLEKIKLLCTIEDAKVSVDNLMEKMEELKDVIQSVEVLAMNKV